MRDLALKRLADGTSAMLVLIAAAAFAFVGMWPVDDGVAARMGESAWIDEAIRRFIFLALLAIGSGLLVFLGHIALYRLASVGSRRHASKWAIFSFLALLITAAAVACRFWIVRPWF